MLISPAWPRRRLQPPQPPVAAAPVPTAFPARPVPAAAASTAVYQHNDGRGNWAPFTPAHCAIIEQAYVAKLDRVHLSMPENPPAHREFEIRFGAAAVSAKMPTPPATGIIQVNVRSENTRVVRRNGPSPASQPTVPLSVAPPVAGPRSPKPARSPKPSISPRPPRKPAPVSPKPAIRSGDPLATATSRPPAYKSGTNPTAAELPSVPTGEPCPAYFHNDGSGTWRPFEDQQNRVIEAAWRARKEIALLPHMPNNPEGNRDFEVRFGKAATSTKFTSLPETGIIQVNTLNDNTRVVRRGAPPAAGEAVAPAATVASNVIQVAAPSVEDVRKAVDKLNHACNELVDTEKSYVAVLEMTVNRFVLPLKVSFYSLPLVYNCPRARLPPTPSSPCISSLPQSNLRAVV